MTQEAISESTEADVQREDFIITPEVETLSDITVTTDAPAVEETAAPETPVETEPEAPAPSDEPFKLPAELQPTSDPAPQGLNELERQRLQDLESREVEFNRARDQQEVAQQTQQLRNHYESLGWDSTTAEAMANIHRQERENAQQQLANLHQHVQLGQAKQRAAEFYGKQEGVDPQALINFNSPAEMEQYAKLLAHTGRLERRTTGLEQDKVKEQHYDGGAGGGATVTSDNIDSLWLNGQVSDDQYDRFLNR